LCERFECPSAVDVHRDASVKGTTKNLSPT
jgi:hypothetical protein